MIVLQQQVSVTFFALLVADDRRATCQRIFGNSMGLLSWVPMDFLTANSSKPVVDREQDAQLNFEPKVWLAAS